MHAEQSLRSRGAHQRPGGAAASSSRSAISLIEFMFVMVLTILFTTVIVSVSLTTGRSFAEIASYVDLDRSNRTAMAILSRRNSRALSCATSSRETPSPTSLPCSAPLPGSRAHAHDFHRARHRHCALHLPEHGRKPEHLRQPLPGLARQHGHGGGRNRG